MQATLLPSANNILTIALRSTLDLSGSGLSAVVIKGLVGASFDSCSDSEVACHIQLISVDDGNLGSALFCADNFPATGRWQDQSLELPLCPERILKLGVTYTFALKVINPNYAQPSPVVRIQMIADYIQQEPIFRMDRIGEYLMGVADGTFPLRVVLPQFRVRELYQKTLLPGRINDITLNLQSDLALAGRDDSAIVVEGFEGLDLAGSVAVNIEGLPTNESIFCDTTGEPGF
eukprot:1714149-Rhodomonas_salina.1